MVENTIEERYVLRDNQTILCDLTGPLFSMLLLQDVKVGTCCLSITIPRLGLTTCQVWPKLRLVKVQVPDFINLASRISNM